jgi:predicted nucleic acid-binding protein
MDTLDLSGLPEGALILLDSAPLIYFLEDYPKLAARFQPLFEEHSKGRLRFAVTTITIAEVLAGPLGASDDSLVRKYRGTLESWQVVVLDADIAESAARIRVSCRLKLADAVKVASALAVKADALVTYDRDFSRVTAPRVIS